MTGQWTAETDCQTVLRTKYSRAVQIQGGCLDCMLREGFPAALPCELGPVVNTLEKNRQRPLVKRKPGMLDAQWGTTGWAEVKTEEAGADHAGQRKVFSLHIDLFRESMLTIPQISPDSCLTPASSPVTPSVRLSNSYCVRCDSKCGEYERLGQSCPQSIIPWRRNKWNAYKCQEVQEVSEM